MSGLREEFEKLDLTRVANGAAVELFDHAMSEVLENILDENRSATEVRKIAMVFEVKANKERNMAIIGVQVKTALAPVEATSGTMFFKSERGKPVAYAHNIHQPSLFDKAGEGVYPIGPADRASNSHK